MTRKLWFRLTAAILLVAVVAIALVAILANQVTSAGFSRFLNQNQAEETEQLRQQLAAYYESQGGWVGVDTLLRDQRPGRAGDAGTFYYLFDADGEIVTWTGGGRRRITEGISPADGLAIVTSSGQRIGTLVVDEPGQEGDQFLDDVNRAIVLGGLAAVVLALLLGGMIARSLTHPLQELTEATRVLSGGNLDRRVEVKGQDEVGELAESFNQMASALSAYEKQRQKLFADIAHELRTPLSVIRGQLEGMLDGVFETTPENLGIVHEETLLLSQLVEELRTLSLVESGKLALELESVDMREVVRQAASAFEPLAEAEGVHLRVQVVETLPRVRADRARLQQVLGNLLSNGLRHAGQGMAQEPEVVLRAEAAPGAVRVIVADNGPGLPAEERQQVFERFWRADTARSREDGGSGLGLAICRGIVNAHGGRIWVDDRSTHGQDGQGGAEFIFEIPAV